MLKIAAIGANPQVIYPNSCFVFKCELGYYHYFTYCLN